MKILHLTAGAGAMYCGSCLHSNTLAAALGRSGADVVLMPLYTPLRTDEENVSIDRLAMGGINVYLQQRWAVFRWLPRPVGRLLDRPGLIRWAVRRGAATRPERLGAMAVAVLRGEEGSLRREVARLIGWIEREMRPDVIHLSSVLLAGLARPLRKRLGVPIVGTLSGEDAFLEKLPPSHYAEARAALRERVSDLDALVAMNRHYADFMAEYLGVAHQRIHVILPGLRLEGHRKPKEAADAELGPHARKAPRTIGFLGRVCPDKGLHLLVEALGRLAGEPDLPAIRLRAAGYLDEADRPYLADLQRQAAGLGLGDRFEYLGELDRAGKIAFLQTLDVMAAPSVSAESKGLPVLEAWANGVPAVLPAHGAFPELVEDTGGGLLFEPCNPAALAAALGRMLRDGRFAAECGRRAHQAVHQRYGDDRMAQQTMELYQCLCHRS